MWKFRRKRFWPYYRLIINNIMNNMVKYEHRNVSSENDSKIDQRDHIAKGLA